MIIAYANRDPTKIVLWAEKNRQSEPAFVVTDDGVRRVVRGAPGIVDGMIAWELIVPKRDPYGKMVSRLGTLIATSMGDAPGWARDLVLWGRKALRSGVTEAPSQAARSSTKVVPCAVIGDMRIDKWTPTLAKQSAHPLEKIIEITEAAVVEDIDVIAVSSLAEAVQFFAGEIDIPPTPPRVDEWFDRFATYDTDFSDVRGQEAAKRAICVAAAGGHNLAMVGPPGGGKTMLAKRIPTILPPLSAAESIETTRVYSALGLMQPGQPRMATRPFRAPHHTISEPGLVGGRSIPMPGEISLAHNGVLFLDELPEFQRRTLEVMRQPLEDGAVTISRAKSTSRFPADFMLVAALNPCPCGYRGDPRRACQCTGPQVDKYMGKISGPLLDRIDIHLEVPAVPFRELAASRGGTSSGQMREAVLAARARQAARFGSGNGREVRCNARMSSRQIREHCRMEPAAIELLRAAVADLGLSARAHDKVLRVGRTIADLDAAEVISCGHVSEAINYRLLDRSLWQ